ncbi:hypothetical protein JOC94_002732 [Bacillus thermophilus]|uniref:Uncharacterized protein n=1 Tax=Siminovitchia thermophila TaxID=1245522 RepID=A0ABS2R7X7_9BACI|nr:hypothetical protein [Siminovitchia thermophila]
MLPGLQSLFHKKGLIWTDGATINNENMDHSEGAYHEKKATVQIVEKCTERSA